MLKKVDSEVALAEYLLTDSAEAYLLEALTNVYNRGVLERDPPSSSEVNVLIARIGHLAARDHARG
ncbi:hypothetical protein WEH80_37165 [Actinomycetes bacterium KLBMP 9759]